MDIKEILIREIGLEIIMEDNGNQVMKYSATNHRFKIWANLLKYEGQSLEIGRNGGRSLKVTEALTDNYNFYCINVKYNVDLKQEILVIIQSKHFCTLDFSLRT